VSQEEKPPVMLPRYMVEEWGLMPLPPKDHEWRVAFNYCGWIAVPKGNPA